VSCEVCSKPLSDEFVDQLLEDSAQARPRGVAERLQEFIQEDTAVKVQLGSADPVPVPVRDEPQRQGCGSRGGCGFQKGAAHGTRTVYRQGPMRSLGDRGRASRREAPISRSTTHSTADRYGIWKRGTRVKIWMNDDSRWVSAKIMKYVSATERMSRLRQQNGGLVGNYPKHKRGMYLVRWQSEDAEMEEDYASEGDATVVPA